MYDERLPIIFGVVVNPLSRCAPNLSYLLFVHTGEEWGNDEPSRLNEIDIIYQGLFMFGLFEVDPGVFAPDASFGRMTRRSMHTIAQSLGLTFNLIFEEAMAKTFNRSTDG